MSGIFPTVPLTQGPGPQQCNRYLWKSRRTKVNARDLELHSLLGIGRATPLCGVVMQPVLTDAADMSWMLLWSPLWERLMKTSPTLIGTWRIRLLGVQHLPFCLLLTSPFRKMDLRSGLFSFFLFSSLTSSGSFSSNHFPFLPLFKLLVLSFQNWVDKIHVVDPSGLYKFMCSISGYTGVQP